MPRSCCKRLSDTKTWQNNKLNALFFKCLVAIRYPQGTAFNVLSESLTVLPEIEPPGKEPPLQ